MLRINRCHTLTRPYLTPFALLVVSENSPVCALNIAIRQAVISRVFSFISMLKFFFHMPRCYFLRTRGRKIEGLKTLVIFRHIVRFSCSHVKLQFLFYNFPTHRLRWRHDWLCDDVCLVLSSCLKTDLLSDPLVIAYTRSRSRQTVFYLPHLIFSLTSK
jgi:hypothetical protein